MGGERGEAKRCSATLMAVAREFPTPEKATTWAAGQRFSHLPPLRKSGHMWAIRARNRASRSKDPAEGGREETPSMELKCTHKTKNKEGPGGKITLPQNGHKVKLQCTSRPRALPERSIFEGASAAHGDISLAIWRWSQKMSPSQTRAVAGVGPHVVADLLHSLRPPCMGTCMDLEHGEQLGWGRNIVAIDKASAPRRKYNEGRAIPTCQICILGMGRELGRARSELQAAKLDRSTGGRGAVFRPKPATEPGRRLGARSNAAWRRGRSSRRLNASPTSGFPGRGCAAANRLTIKREWIWSEGQSTDAI